MNIINWLPIICVFTASYSKIIHNLDEYLKEPPIIDLTSDGAEVTLYVRLCEWSSMNGSQTILNMTRYCYCEQSELDDPDADSCSMPGPTLVMHEETVINVTVINELVGADHLIPRIAELYHNSFKDLDMTNLHVHGLHVSPEIDNVLVEIFPTGGSHSYPYNFNYHYPGTFWYHAHHHVCTYYHINHICAHIHFACVFSCYYITPSNNFLSIYVIHTGCNYMASQYGFTWCIINGI